MFDNKSNLETFDLTLVNLPASLEPNIDPLQPAVAYLYSLKTGGIDKEHRAVMGSWKLEYIL